MKLRAGLIGAGGFGNIHLAAYAKNDNCQLVAVASGTEKSAQLASEKYKIPKVYWGDDWRVMLQKEELDIVSICSPNYLHAKMAIEAIKQNCNIICEKPIAISRDELVKIEAELKKKNVIYFTSFQKRYIPYLNDIKMIIKNNVLGKLTSIRHLFSHLGPYTSWKPLSKDKWFFNSEKAGGGVLMDLGVHSIDLLRYLIGEYSKIEGCVSNTSCKEIDNEDNCHVLVRFQNRALGVISVSWCNEPTEILEIFGTKGILKIDLHSTNPLSVKPKSLKKNKDVKKLLKVKYPKKPDWQSKLIDYFVHSVIQKQQGHPDFLDGKRAVEFVLDAYSLEESKKK